MSVAGLVLAAAVCVLIGWYMRPREQGRRVWRTNLTAAAIGSAGALMLGFFLFDERGWDLLAIPVFVVIVLFGPPVGAEARRRLHPRID